MNDVPGNQMSKLAMGVEVSFDAILGQRFNNNCVYLFLPGEFDRYRDDEKWAFPASTSDADAFEIAYGQRVTVTGFKTFIRDSQDTIATCDVETGELFEIHSIRK
jgi:hypothetical protein